MDEECEDGQAIISVHIESKFIFKARRLLPMSHHWWDLETVFRESPSFLCIQAFPGVKWHSYSYKTLIIILVIIKIVIVVVVVVVVLVVAYQKNWLLQPPISSVKRCEEVKKSKVD